MLGQQPLEQRLALQREYMEKAAELLCERYEHPPLALVHSFGCQQNQSDGEKLRGMLAEMGYGFTDQPEQADLALFNTCAVRENAEDRVFGNVGALKPLKKQRPGMLIGLCGCMMQQEQVADRIRKSYPYVDLVFGTHALYQLPELLFRRLSGEKRQFRGGGEGEIIEGLPLRRDGKIKGNLPIMYGCDNFCSYCIVPYVRGRERSRKPEDVLAEARQLIADGYKEITLLGQNVNSYGKGLEPPIRFAQLLRQVAQLPGEFVVRFMTSHPKDCTTELIDTIAQCDKICNHIHLPVQSGSNRILKLMNRRYTVEHYLELIDYARKQIPGVTFSSDLIVGFPGETYEDFQKTLELVRKVRYSTLYTFLYSRRSGTKAASFEDPVPEEEKSRWFRELLDTESQIREELQQAQVGSAERVLVEGPGRTGPDWLCGRNFSNDIVEFPGSKDLIGQFVDVRIQRAQNWALFGSFV